ncbi:Integrase protein [Pseudomonas savastanoi pv. glycinea]|nr:Integrase protein [Pseudomonas savastanoi pv. glycinea]RML90479.1 Integrase protein [Pseudomonas savastanoi pv. glycinea]
MVRPFIPFPIFPPYSHWYPNREASFPSNLQILSRLNELDVATQPFISTWYADRFVNWSAHNWNPATAHLQYRTCTQGLEKMLNWSFANEVCLLDWTHEDFDDYSEFIQNPPPDWEAPGKQTRYLGTPAKDFKDWAINPNWKLFQRNHNSEPSGAIDKNVWKREIRCVKQFLDFYLKDVRATRKNVADRTPETLVFKEPEPRATITDETMTWMLSALPRLPLSAHDVQVVSMYLVIARHSVRPMWQVLGNLSAPGRIDQFSRNDQGVWQEPHRKTGLPTALPPEFGRAFERYLNYLNIDPGLPLPGSILFSKENSSDALVIKGLWRMILQIREGLADLAQASNSPNIVRAADDIRSLTAAMVSNRSSGES